MRSKSGIAMQKYMPCAAFILTVGFTYSPSLAATVQRVGHFVYYADGPIYEYRVQESGRWKPMASVKIVIPGSRVEEGFWATSSIAASKDGRFLYATADDNQAVAEYRTTKSGRLTPLPEGYVNSDSHPTAITIGPTGRLVYVSCSHGDIWQYRVGRRGQLAPVGVVPLGYGARDPSEVHFTATGRRAWVTVDRVGSSGNATQTVRFRVSTGGKLHAVK